MIIPFPIRIPILGAFIFTSLLVLVELLEHTDPRYSILVFCFFMLSVFAFNTAGGLSRPSGCYIFFFSLLVVQVGTIYKAILGEPAESNLQEPLMTMGAYVGSIGGMLVAAFITRKVATTTDGIAKIMHIGSLSYFESALGSLVMFFLLTFFGTILPGGNGQLLHSIQLINPFLPLSILLGTVAAVRDSRGVRSLNAVNVFAMLYSFYFGTLSFSKQGMFTPITCWLIGLAWARFRLRFIHLVSIGAFIVFAQTVLVPMAQIGRGDITTGDYDERGALVENYLTHISVLRQRARSWEAPPDLDVRMYYYNRPQGIMDRLSMMPNDSVLIDWTDQGHAIGYLPLRFYFENWVPHLIEPHKLEGIRVGGNAYMHEMSRLADADLTTGISFSPTAEAFHMDRWRGVLLAAPLVWLLLFITTDAVCGDIRRQPLGLLFLLVFAHVAPEGLLGGAVELVRLGNAAFIFGMYFCGYVTPIFGKLLRGKHRILDTPMLSLDAGARLSRKPFRPA